MEQDYTPIHDGNKFNDILFGVEQIRDDIENAIKLLKEMKYAESDTNAHKLGVFNNTIEWAKNEITIACSGDRCSNMSSDEYEYMSKCYKMALSVYLSMYDNMRITGLSNDSMKKILSALLDGRPVTPLTGCSSEWEDVTIYQKLPFVKTYKNIRYASLFKFVFGDGSIGYRDISNHYVVDTNGDHNIYFSSKYIQTIVDEMFPITFPYYPPERKMIVHVEYMDGGFCIKKVIMPNGNVKYFNKYYTVDLPDGTKGGTK